jgi:hypothetical protein
MFYNMLIITCLLRLYMWICVYLSVGFGYPFGFRVSTGLVLVMDFHPNRCSVRVQVSTSGFSFRCTETPPDPNSTRCHPYPHARLFVTVKLQWRAATCRDTLEKQNISCPNYLAQQLLCDLCIYVGSLINSPFLKKKKGTLLLLKKKEKSHLMCNSDVFMLYS